MVEGDSQVRLEWFRVLYAYTLGGWFPRFSCEVFRVFVFLGSVGFGGFLIFCGG